MSTAAIILAAGESARLGTPKQLLGYGGKRLLQHAVETGLSAALSPVVVVLGAHASIIRATLDQPGDPRLRVVENSAWREGMAGSLRAGLDALLEAQPEVAAAIVLVCDQPLLSVNHLEALVDAHRRSGCAIVASAYRGKLGVPALFARALFPELLQLQGEQGARSLIRARSELVSSVPFSDGAVDVDTPLDCERLNIPLADLTIPIPS